MAEKENTENTEEKKKGFINIKTIIIIVSIFLFQIVIAFFLMNKVFKPKLQHSQGVVVEKKVEDNSVSEIYLVEDIIVNPRATVGRRYINVSIGLDCNDGSTVSELEKSNIRVRDYLITLFSNSTFDELDDAADKELLRKKILADLNKTIAKKGIRAVYFTNFVLQ